jgi:hypothetical protein
MFAAPAQAGLTRQGYFHDRRRVDVNALLARADCADDALREFLQAIAQ